MGVGQIKPAKRIRCPVKLESSRLEQVLTDGVERTEPYRCRQWVSTQTVFHKVQGRRLSKLSQVTRIQTRQGIIQTSKEKPTTAVGESDDSKFLPPLRRSRRTRFVQTTNGGQLLFLAQGKNEINQVG